MYIKFPYQIDARGRTAETDHSDHILDMIKQVLFTAPGERVNRPTFGSALHQLVFSPNSLELTATVQFLVKGSLQQWLGDIIEVGEVVITVEDACLKIYITYRELQSAIFQEVTLERNF